MPPRDAPKSHRGRIIVRAKGDYFAPVTDKVADLRVVAQEALGKPVRRIGRFIQLALIGAARCAGAASLPPDTAVYLGSRRGDLEVTIEVMEQMFRDGQAPKPLSFINTVSNAACFYIAKSFELHGRSSYLSNVWLPWETALHSAVLDLQAGVTRSALVGCVDAPADPLDVHRRRLRLPPDAPIADASHWLWLESVHDASTPASGLAMIDGVELFSSRDRLEAWITTRALDVKRTIFAAGQHLPAADVRSLMSRLDLGRGWEPQRGLAYTDSLAAYAVSDVLGRWDELGADALLQVSAGPDGEAAAVLLRRSTA
jgi:hypothetical protein